MSTPASTLEHRYRLIVSAGVFLFFALLFIVRSGYSYGAGLLFLTSLVYLTLHRATLQQAQWRLSREDKALMGVLLVFALTASASVLGHGNNIKHLDQLSRYLLGIPVLFLLLRFPPGLNALWSGAALGVTLSIGIAAWQLYVLDHVRAAGYLNIIHFGNIGLVFGLICAAGLRWAATQGQASRRWRFALTIGLLASVYAVIASGSRGSWLALPPVLLIFLVAFVSRRAAPYLAAAVVISLALAAVLYLIPETGIQERLQLAITEIQRYLNERYVFRDGEVSSVGARLEIWRVAMLAIPQSLWLGWNEARFDAFVSGLIQQGLADPYMQNMANTHNNYLEVVLLHGLVGLIPLLALFLVPLALFCRRLRATDPTVQALALAGASFIAAYMMFGVSQVILGRNNGVIFFVMTLSILWSALRHAETRQ